MSGESIEVHIQAITGEDWEAARCQNLSQGVNDPMRRVLRARAQMEHRKKLRAGVDDEPEPQHVLATPEPRSQFIQLEMRELEVAERVLVQRLGMFPSASEKGW
jgi:negative regulator of sigma E activity